MKTKYTLVAIEHPVNMDIHETLCLAIHEGDPDAIAALESITDILTIEQVLDIQTSEAINDTINKS